MKQRQTRRQRKSRRSKKRFLSRKRRYRSRGGANLDVPNGSVVGVNLDPKDPYSVPVFMTKETYEDKILEE